MDIRTTHFDHVLEDALTSDAVDDAATEAAHDKEALRRLQELDSGAVKAIPWEDVRARLLAL